MSRKKVDITYTTNTKKYGEVVDCAVCNGTGKDYTHALMGVKCTTCNGVGKVRV